MSGWQNGRRRSAHGGFGPFWVLGFQGRGAWDDIRWPPRKCLPAAMCNKTSSPLRFRNRFRSLIVYSDLERTGYQERGDALRRFRSRYCFSVTQFPPEPMATVLRQRLYVLMYSTRTVQQYFEFCFRSRAFLPVINSAHCSTTLPTHTHPPGRPAPSSRSCEFSRRATKLCCLLFSSWPSYLLSSMPCIFVPIWGVCFRPPSDSPIRGPSTLKLDIQDSRVRNGF